MTNKKRKMLEQLEEIRSEGNYNMFNRNRVAEEAHRKEFYELFNYIINIDSKGHPVVDRKKIHGIIGKSISEGI